MIKLTRIHWHSKAIEKEPLWVNPQQIVWFSRNLYSSPDNTRIEHTDLCLIGYNFQVVETPDEINLMLRK